MTNSETGRTGVETPVKPLLNPLQRVVSDKGAHLSTLTTFREEGLPKDLDRSLTTLTLTPREEEGLFAHKPLLNPREEEGLFAHKPLISLRRRRALCAELCLPLPEVCR